MNFLLDGHLHSGLLMLAVPIALGFFLTRRFGLGWRLWWIGGAGFVLSQVGHLPFNGLVNSLFLNGTLPMTLGKSAVFAALFGGLSAGLWEELTRAAIFKVWAKDARSWRKGVLLGAGHGGVEAVILAFLVLGNFLYLSAIRGTDLGTIVPPDQLAVAKQGIDAYWSTPWSMSIVGSLERALTIPLHIAFSVLVLQAFTRGRGWWIVLAILFHAAVDAVVVYLNRIWQGLPWAFYGLEAVLAVFTAVALLTIFLLRRPEVVEALPDSGESLPSVTGLRPEDVHLEPTSEDLDRSRYA